MEYALPDYLLAWNFAARAAIPLTLLTGIWLAARRASLPASEQRFVAAILSAAVIVWFALAWWLSKREFFVIAGDELPRIQFAVLLPIVAGLWVILRSQHTRAVVAAVPQSRLVGVQVYRALGAMFRLLWAQGMMPGEFAIPAGVGDIIIGLTAPFVAWLNARRAVFAPAVTRFWNVFGILDLVVAVTTGFLTSPSQFQTMAFERPNLLITAYPLVMVPAFLVPLSIILHVLSLWKLAKAAHGSAITADERHVGAL